MKDGLGKSPGLLTITESKIETATPVLLPLMLAAVLVRLITAVFVKYSLA